MSEELVIEEGNIIEVTQEGVVGPRGAKGDAGAAGAVGATGAAGADGADGSGGSAGANIINRQFLQEVADTTNYTDLIVLDIPANLLGTDKQIEFTLKGHIRNKSGVSGNMILDVLWDNTLAIRSTSNFMSHDISDDRSFEMKFTIQNLGVTNSQFISGHIQINLNDDDIYNRGNLNDDEATANVILQSRANLAAETHYAADTTVDKQIKIRIKPSLAHQDFKVVCVTFNAELK